MKGEPVKYKYNTNLEWISEKKGIIKSNNKPDITVACPPEFGGHPGIWSPEDLFVASVEVCMLTTFLWYIKKENIIIKSYESHAEGTVEMVNGVFRFSLIHVKMKIELPDERKYSTIEKILKKVKRACLISNSIETEITIDPEIIIS
jgi:organic hydroperoxide reductase OsmC/OhrA